jgi:serine/threonine protein phosphatase PrpC
MNEQIRPFEAAKFSLIGGRECNQDRCLVLSSGETVLLGLADGLGGHPRGEIAAQLLVDVCESLFRRTPKPIADPAHFMRQCIGRAHQAIIRFGHRQAPPIAPRSTAVLAVVQSGIGHWMHVGDSRLYLIREGRIQYQTRDHAQIRFVRQSASEVSRPRSSLTRCLGGQEEPPLTTCGRPTRLHANDSIVLCSDGLWGQLSPGALVATFADGKAPLADRLQALVEKAAAHPSSDNVTAVALRWLAAVAEDIRHLHGVLEKNRKN